MTNIAAIASTGTVVPAQDRAKIEKAAKAFEAVFVRQLIGAMRQSGMGDELTGSSAVDQFQEMADARTADTLADKGSLGIAEMMLRQLAPAGKKEIGK
ncbi:MAG: rod-binding protein [Sphingobium sp.]